MPWKKSSVVAQRYALVKALLAEWESAGETCQRFGVSRQTGYKFLRRFAARGKQGLQDRSRRPRGAPDHGREQWRRRLLRLRKRHATWGARKLRWLLRRRFRAVGLPSVRTLQRWLAQAGLSRTRPRLRRRTVLGPAKPATLARRPNAVWTFDLKGWFSTGDGSKVEPLTIRDLWSRYLLWTRPLAPRSERNVRRICQRLFRRHGCPAVIRCDRGAPFYGDGPQGFTRLSLWWWRLGIRVEFVRRGRIDNNAHEQMHGVLQAELTIARTVAAQAQRLERWRQRYNHERPHEALGLRPPASRYRSQPAPVPRLQRPHYPAGWVVRQVQRNGEVYLPHWRGTISRAFAGLPVGFQPLGPCRYRVYFARWLIGELDLSASAKLRLLVS
jgi:putative transposase